MIDSQRKVYIPVVHSSEENIWRRVCVTFEDDLLAIKKYLCDQVILRQEELESTNVSLSEVWLAREHAHPFAAGFEEIYLDNIVTGDCSRYDRTLLFLSWCEEQEEGMKMIVRYK